MERTFNHSVTYTNSGRVPVSDVAASLLANEKLFREALEALQDIYPGLEVTNVDVIFREASSNSPLKQSLDAVANVIFQGDFDKKIPKAIEALTGIDIPKDQEMLVTLVVIAIVTYGVHWALAKIGKKDTPAGLTVTGNYNQIIQIGRDAMGVDEDVLREAVEKRFRKSRGPTVARRALEMLRPAQQEEGAAVTGGGVTIQPETVAAAPQGLNLDPDDDREAQETYPQQEIVIHATDIDSHKTGWAGHLPGIWEKRVPMRLFPAIDPRELFGKTKVIGDVMVISKKNLDGDYIPYVFHVLQIH